MYNNALKKLLVGNLKHQIFAQQSDWVGEGKNEEQQFYELNRYMCNWAAQKSLQVSSSKDDVWENIYIYMQPFGMNRRIMHS